MQILQHTTLVTGLTSNTNLYIPYTSFKKMIGKDFVVSITESKQDGHTWADIKAIFSKRSNKDHSCMNINMFYDLCKYKGISCIVILGNDIVTGKPINYTLGSLLSTLYQYNRSKL